MMKLTSLGLICILFAFQAKANWCSKSYRYESFFLSAGKVFKQKVKKPEILDEMCWRLGEKYARTTLIQTAYPETCYKAFLKGKNDGLKGLQHLGHFPEECYSIGNHFGLSALSTNARSENSKLVGIECVRAYKNGKYDGANDIVATPGNDDKESFCYMTGHFDGSFFNNLL